MLDALPSQLTSESDITYALDKEIGRGGMGVVLAARHPDGGAVAVKVLSDANLGDRFAREVATLKKLNHPGIVRLLDEGKTTTGTPFLVMELLEGTPLDDVLTKQPGLRLPWPEVLRLLEHLLRILEVVHAHGIVHRDIKPSNVFLAEDESVKLLDFGIARVRTTTQQRMTKTGELFGTPEYMSPEQSESGEAVDHRSDLYSVGILGYELLAGAPPFQADAPVAVLLKHVREAVPPLPDDADVPAELATVLASSLAKSPHDRPQSAADFLDALAKVPHPEPVSPTLAMRAPPIRVAATEHISAVPTEPGFVWSPSEKAAEEPVPKVPDGRAWEQISPAAERAHEQNMGTRFEIEETGGSGPLPRVAWGVGIIAAAVIAYLLLKPDPGPDVKESSAGPVKVDPDVGGGGATPEARTERVDVGTASGSADKEGGAEEDKEKKGSDEMLLPEKDAPPIVPDAKKETVDEPPAETPVATLATCGGSLNCFNKGRDAAEVSEWGMAFLYFRRGCARGSGDACFQMAQLLRTHRGDISPSYAAGTSVIGALEKGCKLERPHAVSCFSAGFAHLHELHGVVEDRDKAMYRLNRSCTAGDARGCEVYKCENDEDSQACYAFGKRYKDAEGRDPNAEEYLGRACELKLGESCRTTARYVHARRKVFPADESPSKIAVAYYDLGCTYADLASCEALVEIYAGDYYPTIEANETKQAAYREKACALGAKDCPKADVGAPAVPVSDTDDAQEVELGDASATGGA